MDFTTKKNLKAISALDTPVSEPSTDNSVFFQPKENTGMESKFQFAMKVVRYVLVIYLVIYVILLILNQFDLLPAWLKKVFSPFDIIGISMNQDKQKIIEKEKANQEKLRRRIISN